MKTSFKHFSGLTFIELIISIAIFSQIVLLVGTVVMSALKFNEYNKATRSVNIELYSSIMNGIGPYIRKATGIMYDNYIVPISITQTKTPDEVKKIEAIRTMIHTNAGINAFGRTCTEKDADIFDQITLFQDKEKKEFITFGVEKDPETKTSRLIWKKNDQPTYYLTSEDTYITCFLVSVSPNPYTANAGENAKDIQPYVQIALAGKYRYINASEDEDFLKKNTYTAYKTTFTLRNYTY